MYCPERDLAHIGPAILLDAMRRCDELLQQPWYQAYLAEEPVAAPPESACDPEGNPNSIVRQPWFESYVIQHGITYEMLAEGAKKLGASVNQIITAKNPQEAFAGSGFLLMPPAVIAFFYILLGQSLLASVWSGVKDCYAPDSSTPPSIEALCETINDVAQYLNPQATPTEGEPQSAE
jgi:hypothetical protein